MPTNLGIPQLKIWQERLKATKSELETDKYLQVLYNYLISNNITPPILQKSGRNKNSRKNFILPSGHVGQMNSKFPLSPSQRQTMGHLLSLPVDSVLAVTGPPGTGKTTLIQTIIANSVVESALRGQEPPLIVATSATNNAITNIIESFSSVGSVRRWLPEIKSLGLYLTNSRQVESTDMPVLFSPKIDGTIAEIMTDDYYKRATAEFLKNCNSHFKTNLNTVSKARNHIHTRLREMQSEYKGLVKSNNKRTPGADNLQSDIDALNRQITDMTGQIESAKKSRSAFQSHVKHTPALITFLSFIPMFRRKLTERNKSFLSMHGITETTDFDNPGSIESVLTEKVSKLVLHKNGLSDKRKSLMGIVKAENEFREYCQKLGVNPSLDTIDNELDTGHRATMFELAVHYWEARWLEELAGWLVTEKDKKIGMGAAPILTRYRMHTKLFPCFISTGYSIPKFFTYYTSNVDSRPYLNEIDLLIFDEAGQVPPEVGAVLFSLCKKSVVFGDIRQIEPIVSGLSHNNLCDAEVGFGSDVESLMSVAHMLTDISYDGKNPGLILTEHRRCLPEIIGYCNDLAYNGMLKSLRTGPPGVFPAMSLIPVVGKILHKDRSHYNQEEATAIINWIVENRGRIETHYRKGIQNTVGVITPFRPQFELIAKLLKEVGLPGITVGTNHSLQGAERDIILYSSVYDRQSSPTFLNGRGNLLNVAVSRARDSFILFADCEMIKACPPSSPLGLLGLRTKLYQ